MGPEDRVTQGPERYGSEKSPNDENCIQIHNEIRPKSSLSGQAKILNFY